MITRRRFVVGVGEGALALALPAIVSAQQRKLRRIAYLANDPSRNTPTFRAFVEALRELGWVEGKTIEMRHLASAGKDELFASLAAEAVRENVDVIVTTGSGSTRAAKAATESIPIVFASAANPVEQKFVSSLSHPGSNVTGLALLVQELGPKRLQLMKETLPRAKRFARMYQKSNNVETQQALITEDDAAARSLGIKLEHIGILSIEEIESSMTAAARNQIEAINVKADSLLVLNRALIAKLALKHRIAIMGPDGRFAEAGALMSYGENFVARYRRAGFLVDKILRGTKPADIPIEQPVIFEFVVNLQTAKTLGVTVPEPVVLQADLVIR